MTYIKRIFDISGLLKERSLFLFGPRQTGKSSYLKHQLPEKPAKSYNLLDQGLMQRFMTNPSLMRQEILAEGIQDRLIVIDEVQKFPALLNEVHLLIEEQNIRFLMTGSSARQLKRIGTNLLGGRARSRSFHPFVYKELQENGFDLLRAINHGLLPFHYLSDQPDEDLHAYVGKYLTEEIAAEGIARNIPSFARFLKVAALANAQLVNYSNIASDCGVARTTVQSYFSILRDTLIGNELEPYTQTVTRKAITTAKFYFFDLGLVRILRDIASISESTKDFGDAFEHFIFLELKAYIDYREPRWNLNFWRSTSGFEVDFILNKRIAIEVKASKNLGRSDFKGLKALKEEDLMKSYIIVCQEPTKRLVDGILIYPWEMFLDDLWTGKLGN